MNFEIATVYPQDIADYIVEKDQGDQRSEVSSLSSMSATSSENEVEEDFDTKDKTPYILSIIKRFDFDSKLARMSVIVKNKKDNQYRLYTKGAPENIRRLCIQESIPSTFHDILKMYAEKGLRVLALAYKDILNADYYKVSNLKRDKVEFELKFLGFVLLNNELKLETIPTLNVLHKAKIKTIMATGDNPLTSISVARECGMVDTSLPVYMGELVTLKNGEKKLTWTNVDKSDSKLDPLTLKPLDVEEEEFKKSSQILNESNSLIMFR